MKSINSIILSIFIAMLFSLTVQANQSIQKGKFSQLNDSIETLNKKISEYELIIDLNKKEYSTAIKDETIQYQNSIIDSFGIIYTIITIIIALLGFSLPILIYLFGIRPARKAINNLESNLESKIENYLKEQKSKNINQSIINLESESPILRSNALNFLSLSLHDGLSEEHLFRVYKLLIENKVDELIEENLVNILSSRKNDFADIYFKELLFDEKRYKLKRYVYIYFANVGIDNYLSIIIEYLKKFKGSKDQIHTLGGALYPILDTIINIDKNSFLKVLNNKEIVDLFEEKELKSMRESLINLRYKKNIYKDYESLINDTYIMKK